MSSFTTRPAQKSKRPTTAKYRAGTKPKTLEERSRSRSQRKHEQMYTKTDLFNRKEKSDAQKREETKKELKSLLTKYIGSENSKYAVSNAQHKIGILNTRHDKAAEEMQKCN